MDKTPNKRPIRFLEKHLINHNKTNLEIIATQFPNINKWILNEDIDNEFFNNFWSIYIYIVDLQKACLLKLKHGQHMENAKKNNNSLEEKHILPLHAQYVIYLNKIHDYIYFLIAKNNTSMLSTSKDITKEFGN